MSYKTGLQRQRSALLGHLLYLVASVGTSFLIYWIAGGFPPSPWIHLWNILSQMNSLWAANGVAVFFPTLILGLQLLLFVLVGGASLGFVVYEIVMILDVFSVWQSLAFLRQWFHAFTIYLRASKPPFTRAKQPQAALSPGQAASIVALPAPHPQVAATLFAPKSVDRGSLPALSQGILPLPKRDDLVSNTMSPALPESMRWILRSPESLAQSGLETPQEQLLTSHGLEKHRQLDVSEEKTLPSLDHQEPRPGRNPLLPTLSKYQGEEPFDDPLANPFENAEPSKGDPLARPFEEKIRGTLPFLFPEGPEQLSFAGLPINSFDEEHGEEDTLPSIFTGQQEEDPLANPFENAEEEDPLANPFEGTELAEDDPLANPFEEDEILPAPSSTNNHPLPVEDSLANPFEENTERDETSPSPRAVRRASSPAEASKNSPVSSFNGRKEVLVQESATEKE